MPPSPSPGPTSPTELDSAPADPSFTEANEGYFIAPSSAMLQFLIPPLGADDAKPTIFPAAVRKEVKQFAGGKCWLC